MSDNPHDPLWPRFWSEVPASDRAPMREVLAELLGRGVLLGDEGSGRDLFLLARDHYRTHLEDYLAPLALELFIDDDACLIQARPRVESCLLLGRFDKDETLLLLALWRLYDDERSSGLQEAVIVTVDQLWAALKVFFDQIDPPQATQIDSALAKLKRHRLIRTARPEGMTQPGELQIEILPSLSRVIPFEDIEAWQAKAAQFSPQPTDTGAPAAPEDETPAADEEEAS